MRRTVSLLLALFLLGNWADARQDAAVCGSHPERLREELHLHRKAARLRQARAQGLQLRTAGLEARAAGRDVGDIALIEDADGVVSRRNDFDLDGGTVTFLPAAAGASRYRFEVGDASYDADAAFRGPALSGFGDDDTRRIGLPFAFPFFGNFYTEIHVNSDGNLTFNTGDTSTSERSLGRLTAGPPRIAGLFRDLDPTRAYDGVHVLAEAARVVVSWVEVPEYSSSGAGPRQTFQIRLFPDGQIELAYQTITTLSAVVGIAPGGLLGTSAVVSFSAGSAEEFSGAVAERFTNIRELDIVLTAQKFYETHDDGYDYLVMFNNLGISAAPGAVAFEITVRNNRTGFGDLIVDVGAEFGSPRQLQALMNMGQLSQYPVDPNQVVSSRATTGDTPLTVLGHEAGHLFLAFASVRNPQNPQARPMLGRQAAHWSFYFNSEASLLEGNRICDKQAGTCPDTPGSGRFVTTATVEGFAPLDQYLMGFRPPWEVPDTFLVTGSSVTNPSRMPQAGVVFDGQRRDIHIEEVIEAEGRRTPDHTVAQRRFRFAFILVIAEGSDPSAAQIEQVDHYRREFESFYHLAAGERAWADTSLRRALRLSTFPASGVLVGGAASVTIAVDDPVEADLEVLLASDNGGIGIPASVTIPAGATSATFQIAGIRAGVDELSAEVPGGLYQGAYSKLQVSGVASGLRLVTVSGDKQVATPGQPLPEPVVLRLSDINNLAYPGVRIAATVTGDGAVEPAEAVTDDSGQVSFNWTPGAGPLNELEAVIAGGALSVSATVTATGQPWFASTGVVNAATFSAPISPGSLASIFGANLAAGAVASAGDFIPDRLAGVQVLFNGQAALLLFVSDRQINFVVPDDLLAGEAELVVSTILGVSAATRVGVEAVSPGIFVMPGSGLGAVTVAGTGRLTSEQPAAAGEWIEIYSTGLGAVQPHEIAGLSETVLTPQVSIAERPAQVQFSGLAPGWVGLYQVNVQVPVGTPPGTQILSLSIGGVPANEVQIRIQ